MRGLVTWGSKQGDTEDTAQRKGSLLADVDLPMRRLVIALAGFSAVSAMGGATELLVWPTGNRYVPLALLEYTPFATFLFPGLLLGIVVGGTSLSCAILAWRRSRTAVDTTILAGGALSVWIAAEIAMMRGFHALHGIYGGLGVALLGLGVHAAWCSHSPRHRWLILVTLAETIGFLVPACTGVLSSKAGMGGLSQAALLAGAGLVEGLALGVGQASALPLPVRRTRYALVTALGAGIVWSSFLLISLVAETETVPVPILILAGVATAIVGLGAIGSFQWLELRHQTQHAHRWIAWTALAWALALPFSFAPGPFVDESTPLLSHLILWGCGGVLMAYAMSLITWQGVRRLGYDSLESQENAIRPARAERCSPR